MFVSNIVQLMSRSLTPSEFVWEPARLHVSAVDPVDPPFQDKPHHVLDIYVYIYTYILYTNTFMYIYIYIENSIE